MNFIETVPADQTQSKTRNIPIILALFVIINLIILAVKLNTVEYEKNSSQKETKLITDFCPSWDIAQLDYNAPKSCIKLDSSKEFDISLCTLDNFCGSRGFFLVERVDKAYCKSAMNQRLSNNPEMDQYLKKEIGPDAWYMVFDGPERYVPSNWTHLGNCIVKLPFILTNPGIFNVSLMLSHSSFSAVNEIDNVYPEAQAAYLFKDYKHATCLHCPKFTYSNVVNNPSIPDCKSNSNNKGVWLRIDSSQPTPREAYKLRNYDIPYIWTPLGCKYTQLFEFRNNDFCYATNRSVYFMGDSQLRQAFYLLDRRMVGLGEALTRAEKEFFPFDRVFYSGFDNSYEMNVSAGLVHQSIAHPSIPHLSMKYSFDGYFQLFDQYHTKNFNLETEMNEVDLLLYNFDTLVLESGHWAFAGENQGGHWTISRFLHFLEYIMDIIDFINIKRTSRGLQKLQVIWTGVYSFYICQKPEYCGIYRAWKNWRTPQRLKLANDLSNDLMRRRGAKVIDSNDLTLPWIQESPDRAHFHTTPGLDAVVDETLQALNLCNF